jgi:hypothetical protein
MTLSHVTRGFRKSLSRCLDHAAPQVGLQPTSRKMTRVHRVVHESVDGEIDTQIGDWMMRRDKPRHLDYEVALALQR